ncbi:hypothetical protein BX600DRAFT_477329 [Xylariales sp. PMI_506]|nr:hypothetical protein BX600DRAFT_477329 [Xylariales sp. PMI_506]
MFPSSNPRLWLRLIPVALVFVLLWHLFQARDSYITIQQIIPGSAVGHEEAATPDSPTTPLPPPPSPPPVQSSDPTPPLPSSPAAAPADTLHDTPAPAPTPVSVSVAVSVAVAAPTPSPATAPANDGQVSCDALHEGFQDIFLIMRTGANEALNKLPVHFNTTLRCVPHASYGIWSDLAETIDGHSVNNALDHVSADIVANNPDFEYYRRLQEYGRDSFSIEDMTSWANAPNSAGGRDTPGWKLDKWKFLPLAQKAYHQRPDVKWYVFSECDGYINWTSLLRWLKGLDASKAPYVGQLMIIGDVVFAYGGASFAISNAAMKKVVEHYESRVSFYEDFTAHHWAGDCVLGKALLDVGIEFTQAWPTFFGDSLYDMDYNSSVSGPDQKLWCYSAMTWHHLSPYDIREVAAFEQKWNLENTKILRHGDVFRNFVMPRLGSEVKEWDNMSADTQDPRSMEDCRKLCQSRSDCYQFSFDRDTSTCKTSNKIKLGYGAQRKGSSTKADSVTSGWMMDRVYDFVEEMDTSCHSEGWVIS